MEKIEYLPKFYGKEEKVAKFNELKEAKAWLKATHKLNEKEMEKLNELVDDFPICGDAYSRNYVIREINQLISFVKCR